MKKFFYLIIVFSALLTLSCSKIKSEQPSVRTLDLTFDASFFSDTRTLLSPDDSAKILWSAHDTISLFWSDWSTSKFVSINETPTQTTRFQGSIEVISGDYDPEDPSKLNFLAAYPYKENSVSDGETVTLDVDSLQYAVENSLPEASFPAVAKGTNLNLAFRNVCGGICFTVIKDDIKYIQLTSVDSTPVAGRIKVAFDEDIPTVEEILSPVKSVFLYAPDGGTFNSGSHYYVALLPSVHESGIKITLYTETTKADTTIAGPKEIKRNVFANLVDIDKDLLFPIKVSSITLDVTSARMEIGSTKQLTATVLPEDATNKEVVWSSSDEAIASVDQTGLVTAVGEGTCEITVQSVDDPNVKAVCVIQSGAVVHLTHGGKGYANCFIVTSEGKYDFEMKRVGGTSVGTPASVEVLWEYICTNVKATKGSLIASVSLDEDKVLFETADTLYNGGNALIAVKDADSTILWSWHIWVAKDYDADGTAILCPNGQYMMDRHLGSIKAPKPIPNALIYQWGRKDPFLPESYPSVYSTGEWPDKIQASASVGTLAYVTANPMTFLYNSGDWCFESDAAVKSGRWSDSYKTDYDPCPYGWKVPTGSTGGFWDTAISSYVFSWDTSLQGFEMPGSMGWFQTTGAYVASGSYSLSTSVVKLWTSTYMKSDRGWTLNAPFSLGKVQPTSSEYCAIGAGVRCVKDVTE